MVELLGFQLMKRDQRPRPTFPESEGQGYEARHTASGLTALHLQSYFLEAHGEEARVRNRGNKIPGARTALDFLMQLP